MFYLIIIGLICFYFINKHKLKNNNLTKTINPEVKNNETSTIHSYSNFKTEDQKNLRTIVFFDTETNGLSSENSVLSIAAIKAVINLENFEISTIDKYQRYYFPTEAYNHYATKVNGLTYKKVDNLRKQLRVNYPKHFHNDFHDFYKFIGNCKHFVAHNIEFDKRFINKSLDYEFCTMKTNTSIVGAISPKTGKIKWPKLIEAAKYYNIKVNENEFHDSLYDVKITLEVFKKMFNHPVANSYAKEFIYNNSSFTKNI